MKNIGLKSNFNFFKAITSDDICRDEYKDYIDFVTEKKIGRLGCWLSHINIWKKYKNYTKPILVIEDDVRFVTNFPNELKQIVNYLNNNPKIDWDLCFLGRNQYDNSNENISLNAHELEKIQNKFYQFHCYLVNCKNIDKLLKYCDLKNIDMETFKKNSAIDVYIPGIFDKLNLLGVKNQLAIQVSSSEYGGSNTG